MARRSHPARLAQGGTNFPEEPGVSLFGWSAVGLYLMPVLMVSYDFRYGVPPETFVVVSGLLGTVACWRIR